MENLTHVYTLLGNSTRLQTEVRPEEIPIESFIAIAFFMTFIFIVGFAENSFAFFIFYRTKALHTTNNMLIAGLVLCDWCQSVFGMPLVVASSIAKKWIFGQGLCVYYGFITTFMGITQITNLTAISLNKYFAIVRHSNLAFLDPNRAILAIIACYMHGFLWAIFPVIGWSSYQLEGANVSCSIPWESKATKDVSYCLALSAFAWILPLGIITFTYLSIWRLVSLLIRFSQMEFPTYQLGQSISVLKVVGCYFSFQIQIEHSVSKHTVQALIRCRFLWRLVWVYTICL